MNRTQIESGLPEKDILLLGMGNILRRDDGIGIHVVDLLKNSQEKILPENVEVLDGGTTGYGLLPYLLNRRGIIIIDALKTDDRAGSIYRFPASHIRKKTILEFTPSFSLRELLFHLELMNNSPEVEIIGIVPEDISSMKMGISPLLQTSVPRIMEVVKLSVEDMIGRTRTGHAPPLFKSTE